MPTDPKTPLLGFLGTLSTFTLSQLNDAIGVVAGVLTVAYLVRQHVHFRRDKRK
ncbi:hypothetical protein [Oleiharenicola sp. Vm1]|uniref:hypothetical protein n=1 Tax=Oleiharenicola sp. Vm1 TaxID=3398393 RepID=UPI0039F4F514